ncbi:MAG: FliI/YscN family ATPase [Pseudomonadota bacterium]
MEPAWASAIDAAVFNTSSINIWGRVEAIERGLLRISGISKFANVGDMLSLNPSPSAEISAEIISADAGAVLALPVAPLSSFTIGAQIYLEKEKGVCPTPDWLGQVVNARGEVLNEPYTPHRGERRDINVGPPPAARRKRIGGRLKTGLAALDTFLPLCAGQRVGLFAGSGVGKSTLLAALARELSADVVVVALIGERGREVREFVDDTLGEKGRERSVVVTATSDAPPTEKRRAALTAMTTAEYFRDQGKHVLLLFDSITRFAEAHREIALTAGETPSLRAFPPSTFSALAKFCERAGPGVEGAGDITAVFSVLVAGSDMDEPIADMVRGTLDGHFILDRQIAERGRFPALDIRRSVSRSLPGAATADENQLLTGARRLLGAYEEAATMIRAGLYSMGSDPVIDEAIKVWPLLDDFFSTESDSIEDSFKALQLILAPPAIAENTQPE